MVLPIRVYGDPCLRQKANDIVIYTEEDAKLFEDMKDTLAHFGGVGLSANQIGSPRNMFLVQVQDMLKCFVNPKIIDHSDDFWEAKEGCLSILVKDLPTIRRWKSITLRFQDESGMAHEREYDGWLGRVIQHECAHLRGELIFDMASATWKKQNLSQLKFLRQKHTEIKALAEKQIEDRPKKSLIIT